MKRYWWLISIAGYGDFAFYGTEREAENMRRHKAYWEGGTGRKEQIAATHREARAERKSIKIRKGLGCCLDEREYEAIGIKLVGIKATK